MLYVESFLRIFIFPKIKKKQQKKDDKQNSKKTIATKIPNKPLKKLPNFRQFSFHVPEKLQEKFSASR